MNEESKTPRTDNAELEEAHFSGVGEHTAKSDYVKSDDMRAIEIELNSALSQLTEKDKEIAMLMDQICKDREVMGFLQRVAEEHKENYIHTDKVKPLVEALESVLIRDAEWDPSGLGRVGNCNCINLSRKSEIEYETGKCPHQKAVKTLAQYKKTTGE